MSEVQDAPAVPPMDAGADVRYGWLLAGGLLIVLGWGIFVVLNLYVHATAGPSGTMVGPQRVYHPLGPFAEASAVLGAATGLVGAVLIYFGWTSPKGRFVLPGAPY